MNSIKSALEIHARNANSKTDKITHEKSVSIERLNIPSKSVIYKTINRETGVTEYSDGNTLKFANASISKGNSLPPATKISSVSGNVIKATDSNTGVPMYGDSRTPQKPSTDSISKGGNLPNSKPLPGGIYKYTDPKTGITTYTNRNQG